MSNRLEFKVTRLHRLETDSSVKAFVDIAVNDSFLLKGLRIVQGKKGLFVSMPREKGSDGRWYEVVSLLDPLVRQEVFSLVLKEFEGN